MLILASFEVENFAKQPKCQSFRDGLNDLWYNHDMNIIHQLEIMN